MIIPRHTTYLLLTAIVLGTLASSGAQDLDPAPLFLAEGLISRSGRGIGKKHIYAILRGYRMFFVSTDVGARIAFDQDGNLLKVEVEKYRDSL